jgi:hypothetical protein
MLLSFSSSLLAQETSPKQNTEVQEVTTVTTVTSTPTEKKHKFWFGPKFGLDIPSNSLNKIGDQLNTNYRFGLFAQFGRTLYFQPEIYYASYKTTATSKSTNYIKMPLMIGLKFLDLGLFSLHIMTGPSLSFKLDDNDALTGYSESSWQLGAGVDVLGFITSDIRYKILKGVSLGDQISKFSTNPNILNLTVGLKLR